jgi:carbonic anhydrase
MTITGPLADFLERNKKHQETLQTPPNMQQMSKRATELGTGVFIITCSDPRLNPYRILGLDDQNQEMREFDRDYLPTCSPR